MVAADSGAAGASSRLRGCEGAPSCPRRPVRCVGFLVGVSHKGLTPAWGPERPLCVSKRHIDILVAAANAAYLRGLVYFICRFIHICDTKFRNFFRGSGAPDSRDFFYMHGG